jgi:60 kDa SS-A/Ro ribonucleoprotein
MAKKSVYSETMNGREKIRARVQAANKGVSQFSPIPGRETEMVRNSDGAFTFSLDKWGHARRFLILGSEGGSYYATPQKLTQTNAKNLIECIKEDGPRLVDMIVEVSERGLAPKNDPALFALALAITHGDSMTQLCAGEAFPMVARIGTHVLHLADFVNGMRSWGRPVRRGFANIYNEWNDFNTAMQLVKYANRDGWTHKDVLRLAHIKPSTPTKDALFSRALGKEEKKITDKKVREFLVAVDSIKRETDPKKAAKLIADYRLPREVVPTELLNEKVVWDALLPHMGLEALVRNLATMTRVGVIAPMSNGVKTIIEKMGDVEAVKASRIHPIKVLTAYLTYAAGVGVRGGNTWTPNKNVLEATDSMFYTAFQNIRPTGKRVMYALDVSPSMWGSMIANVPNLSAALAGAALVSFMVKSEQLYEVTAFSSGGGTRGWGYGSSRYNNTNGITPINISKTGNLNSAMKAIQAMSNGWGGTDCSLPFEYARKQNIPVDAFVVVTDSDTNTGRSRHPMQALKDYRQKTGIPAKLIVMGTTATNFTIADPKDGGSLDVVGFDTSAPTLVNDFIRGDL